MRPPLTIAITSLLISAALASPVLSQVIVRERASGSLDLVQLPNRQTVLQNVQLLDCELTGYALKDRLRLAYPRPGETTGLPDHVLLPGGGSLWRAAEGADQMLLHIDPLGELRTLLRVPMTSGGISSRISVSVDGGVVIASTGSAVWRVDMAGTPTATCLTVHLGPLSVASRSLRVNAHTGYFVADDDLYRCPAGATGVNAAIAVSIPLASSEEIVEELVLASSSATVLVTLEREEDERRLLAVHAGGAVEILTPVPTTLPLPGFDENLGPFTAISPDGMRAAWRTEGASEELYLTCLNGGIAHHVTTLPEFPVYLDNVGVLAFGTANRLCFFAGDRVLSGITGAELMGAADMYAITIDPSCGLHSRNVSGTSGGFTPPFTEVGQMTLQAALLDPLGERFFVEQEPSESAEFISIFPINALPGQTGYGAADMLLNHEDFEYRTAGTSILVMTEYEEGSSEVINLSLIPPHQGGRPRALDLGEWHGSTQLDQVTFSGSNACVRLRVLGEPQALWVNLANGTVQPVLPMTIGHTLHIDSPLAFDHQGRLLLGATKPNGHSAWLGVTSPGSAHVLRVPARRGFVLPY